MKENEAFPGTHLKWQDVESRPAKLTIASVAMGEIGQGKDKEMKPIVSFKGTEKTLVLNKTNFNRIAHLTQQPDTDDWAGHQITLFVDVTEYQGKSVNCIRIQMAPPQSSVQVDYNPDPKAEAPSLDDIPF